MAYTAAGLQSAKLALTKVLADKGVTLAHPDAIYWLLGQIGGESNFGTTPDWTIPNELNTQDTNPLAPPGPSHNWGAVHAMGDTTPFIWHGDRSRNNSSGVFKFARFSNPESAAGYYANALLRLDINNAVKNVLTDPNGTPLQLARAMYSRSEDPSVFTYAPGKGYFTGTVSQGSDQQIVQNYANMIAGGANQVKKILGLPANVTANGGSASPSGAPSLAPWGSPAQPAPSSWPYVLGFAVVSLGIVGSRLGWFSRWNRR
jgi:hypothetical protein